MFLLLWFAVRLLFWYQNSKHFLKGSFLPYNPSSYLDDPKIDGFIAGTYIDGSRVYVGRGDNSANGGEKPCTARISDDPLKPGAFMEATNQENFDGLTSEYLYNHRDLVWIKLNYSTILYRNPYAISFVSGSKAMMIARKVFSNYTQIGKVRFLDFNQFIFKLFFLDSIWKNF